MQATGCVKWYSSHLLVGKPHPNRNHMTKSSREMRWAELNATVLCNKWTEMKQVSRNVMPLPSMRSTWLWHLNVVRGNAATRWSKQNTACRQGLLHTFVHGRLFWTFLTPFHHLRLKRQWSVLILHRPTMQCTIVSRAAGRKFNGNVFHKWWPCPQGCNEQLYNRMVFITKSEFHSAGQMFFAPRTSITSAVKFHYIIIIL